MLAAAAFVGGGIGGGAAAIEATTALTTSSFLGDLVFDLGNLPSSAFPCGSGHVTLAMALLWAAAALIYYALVAIATRGDKYKRHETDHAIFCPSWHSPGGLVGRGRRHYRCCSHRKGCLRCRNNNNLGNGSGANNNGDHEETQGSPAAGSEASSATTQKKCALARMHMPPPLPLRPRKRRNKQPRPQRQEAPLLSSSSGLMGLTDADVITIRPAAATATLLRQQHVAVASRASLKRTVPTTGGVSSSIHETSSVTSLTTTMVPQQEMHEDKSSVSIKKKKKSSRKLKKKHKSSSFSSVPMTTETTVAATIATPDLSSTTLPIPRSTLIDLARMQDWSNLVIRCDTHRREAKRRDSDGLLPLHWACSGGPNTEAIHALLTAYPRSVRMVDSDGSTALHFAAHYGGSADVMEVLLEAYPDAIRITDAYGRTPLYHAVDKGASIDVLRVLLRADSSLAAQPCVPPVAKTGDSPSSAMSTKKTHRRRSSSGSGGFGPFRHIGAGRAPLTIAWNAMLSLARTKTSLVATGAGPSLTGSRYRKPHRWTGKKWDKAVLLLKSAFLGSVDENEGDCGGVAYPLFQPHYHPPQKRKFRMVHAVLMFDHLLPPSAIDVALEVYPEQLTERDELTGQTPLDQLASSKRKYISDERFQAILEALIWANPTSAYTPDEEGRYPLNMALESGRVWRHGIRELFHSAPDFLWEKDTPTGLFPFMLAAVATPASPPFLQCPSSDFGVAKKPAASLLSSTSKAVAFMGDNPPRIDGNDSINSRIYKRRRLYASARNYSLDSTAMAAIAAAAAVEAAEAAAASAEQAAAMNDSGNVPLKKFVTEQQGEEGQQDRLLSHSENSTQCSSMTAATSSTSNGTKTGFNMIQNSRIHSSTKEADVECQHLTTIYELLRACPEGVYIG